MSLALFALCGVISLASSLTFNSTIPDANDSLVILHQKTVQAINANTIARLQNAASTSTASPEGVVTADPGTGHFDTALNRFYIKSVGVGNTNWILIFTVQ